MISKKAEMLILSALLLIALVVRVVGIDWGLPYLYHPDEPTHVGLILNILKTGDLNPHWFKYPSFRIYASLPVAAAYFLMGVSRGAFSSIQQLTPGTVVTVGTGITQIPNLYLALRLYMALFGVLSVGLIYYWGKRYFNGIVGILAALLLTFEPIHVLTSHWFRPDTILALFCGAAVFATLRLYRRDDLKSYLICGVWVGLAASVKYNAAALQMVPLIFAHLLARRSLWDKRLLYAILAAIGTFFIITPFALLDIPSFLDGFAYEINHYYVLGQPGAVANGGFLPNLAWYLSQLIRYDGLLVLLAALAPFVASRERRNELVILACWPIIVLLLNATAAISTELALVPIILVLCILAAFSLAWLFGKIAIWLPAWNKHVLMVGCLVLTLAIPVGNVVYRDAEFVHPDAREMASEWISTNLPADALIALEGYSPYLKNHPAIYVGRLIEHSVEWYQVAGVRYLVASSYASIYASADMFPNEIAAYEQLFSLPLVQTITGPMQYRVEEPDHQIRIYEVPVADRYTITAGNNSDPWFKAGFYEPEADSTSSFRWTAGEASLVLNLHGGTSYQMMLEGRSGRPLAVPSATTTVRVNDQVLAEHTWSIDSETWTFELLPEGSGNQSVVLVFDTNTWQPADYTGSTDKRELGFIFDNLRVETR